MSSFQEMPDDQARRVIGSMKRKTSQKSSGIQDAQRSHVQRFVEPTIKRSRRNMIDARELIEWLKWRERSYMHQGLNTEASAVRTVQVKVHRVLKRGRG